MLLFGFNTLRDYNNSPLLLIIVHCYTWAAASLSYVATYVPLVALNIKYVCSMMRISNSEYITGQGGLYHLRFSVLLLLYCQFFLLLIGAPRSSLPPHVFCMGINVSSNTLRGDRCFGASQGLCTRTPKIAWYQFSCRAPNSLRGQTAVSYVPYYVNNTYGKVTHRNISPRDFFHRRCRSAVTLALLVACYRYTLV